MSLYLLLKEFNMQTKLLSIIQICLLLLYYDQTKLDFGIIKLMWKKFLIGKLSY